MANNGSTRQPGSEKGQGQARDTGGQRPNGERNYHNEHKSKQDEADDLSGMSKKELQDERGGKGHSGHSSKRSGSDSGN